MSRHIDGTVQIILVILTMMLCILNTVHRQMVKDICSLKKVPLTDTDLAAAARDNWKYVIQLGLPGLLHDRFLVICIKTVAVNGLRT